MNDELFKKVEKKTNVKKENILSLAKMINDNGLKDEKTLKKVISELSSMTGKKVSNELEEKIINAVLEDKIPKNVDNMF